MNNKDHEDNKKISDSVLQELQKAGVRPRTKFYFTARNALVWVLVGTTTLIGSLFVSSLIFRFVNFERALPPHIEELLEQKSLIAHDFPFVLFILFLVSCFLVYVEIRFTRRGYKYEMPVIFLSIGLVSVVLGVCLYIGGAGYHVDRLTARGIPFHPDISHIQEGRWFSPQEGVLVGQVLEISDQSLVLRDPKGKQWSVFFDTEDERDGGEKIIPLFLGQRIGVMGMAQTGDFIFQACDIQPLDFKRDIRRPDMGRKIFEVRITKCEERTTSQLIINE